MKEFHLVSAPFSCGISWAVSVLMELGIRTTHTEPKRYPNGFWRPVPGFPGQEEIVPEGMAHMRYYLPLLQERTRFQLDPAVEVFWEHRLDFLRDFHRPAIVFVRDPRDAIRSLYLRNYTHFGWHEYLRRPDLWADHFPGMFGLPPSETWAAWHAAWLGASPPNGRLVVRFEHTRERPVESVLEMLRFLGVERPRQEIERAVEASTFEKTRTAMERTELATGVPFRIARRGKVGEWTECFDDEALALFGGPAAEWMTRLGYTPARVSADAPPAGPPLQEDELSPELRSALARARQAWSAGAADPARLQFRDVLRLARQGTSRDRAELLVAAEWVSFEWTSLVLGRDAEARHPAWTPLLESFLRFNRRFALWPSVRAALLAHTESAAPARNDVFGRLDVPRVELNAPVSDRATVPSRPAPMLIEENYRGYDVFGCSGQFFAVARGGEAVDWSRLTRPQLAEEQRRGRIFVADLAMEAKEAVDRHLLRVPAPLA